jgi:hypothetical protein
MARKKQLPPQATETKGGKNLPDQSGDISPDRMSPLWSFASLDVGSTWCWSNMTPDLLIQVLARFKNLETMTWGDIKRTTGSHNVETYRLVKEARDRLEEIGLEYIEELFSLRVTGERRVWGILDNHVLRILWWDPEHEICPSVLKHT